MNTQTFFAMLHRDAHVARRRFVPLLVQTTVQPMLFVFIFGRVMTSIGFMPAIYKSLLLPGIMVISMVIAGIWAVSMPLIAEFQFTREIEDRLLAPIAIEWVAIQKVVSGTIQAIVAGVVVLLAARLIMGPGIQLQPAHPLLLALVVLLVSLLAAAIGLTLGCALDQQQIGMMFAIILGPMIFFGCTYYPWASLARFPIMQKLLLLNPVVYASEGARSVLTPQLPHLSLPAVLTGLIFFTALFLVLGLRKFNQKAIQ